MLFAAFETSAEWCSVALWRDGEVAAIEARAANSHGERALPALERLLAQAGAGAKQLDAVAFGAGPGSFTGLRIACGLAQGIAWANEVPVIGVSTLEAMAEECGASKVIACVDARMREVYYSAWQKDGSAWREVIQACCVAPGKVAAPEGADWFGCGSGFAAHGEAMENALRGHLRGIDVNARPGAVSVARLAAPRLAAGQGVDASLAVPAYVRDKIAFSEKERAAR